MENSQLAPVGQTEQLKENQCQLDKKLLRKTAKEMSLRSQEHHIKPSSREPKAEKMVYSYRQSCRKNKYILQTICYCDYDNEFNRSVENNNVPPDIMKCSSAGDIQADYMKRQEDFDLLSLHMIPLSEPVFHMEQLV
jgi:hypothetical protein